MLVEIRYFLDFFLSLSATIWELTLPYYYLLNILSGLQVTSLKVRTAELYINMNAHIQFCNPPKYWNDCFPIFEGLSYSRRGTAISYYLYKSEECSVRYAYTKQWTGLENLAAGSREHFQEFLI